MQIKRPFKQKAILFFWEFFFIILLVGILILNRILMKSSEDKLALHIICEVLMIICLLFFLIICPYVCKSFFSKNYIFEITDTYLYDRTSVIALGPILLKDIKSVYFKGMFLVIKLHQPEKYLAKVNVLKRMLIKANIKLNYGIVCITENALGDQIYEAYKYLQKIVEQNNYTRKSKMHLYKKKETDLFSVSNFNIKPQNLKMTTKAQNHKRFSRAQLKRNG